MDAKKTWFFFCVLEYHDWIEGMEQRTCCSALTAEHNLSFSQVALDAWRSWIRLENFGCCFCYGPVRLMGGSSFPWVFVVLGSFSHLLFRWLHIWFPGIA